jgi:hypothetical protein
MLLIPKETYFEEKQEKNWEDKASASYPSPSDFIIIQVDGVSLRNRFFVIVGKSFNDSQPAESKGISVP